MSRDAHDPAATPEGAPRDDEDHGRAGGEVEESPAAGVLDPDLDAPPEPGEPG